MKKEYRLPITGKYISKEPLKGDPDDPVCVVPFYGSIEFDNYVVKEIDIEKAEAIIELDAPEASHTEVLNILKDKTHTQLYEITKTKKLKKKEE